MDGLIARIDHVSFAVRDFEKAERFFRTVLGAVPGAVGEDSRISFFWQVFSLGDLSRIEIIKPTGAGSFLEPFLSEREGGVHHVTMQTPDIEHAKKVLEQNGVPYFGYNEYQGAYWKELFIHPKHAFGVLIQIAEFEADDWLGDAVKIPGKKRWRIEKNESGATLSFSHPGGGQVRLRLTREEAGELISDLEKNLR